MNLEAAEREATSTGRYEWLEKSGANKGLEPGLLPYS